MKSVPSAAVQLTPCLPRLSNPPTPPPPPADVALLHIPDVATPAALVLLITVRRRLYQALREELLTLLNLHSVWSLLDLGERSEGCTALLLPFFLQSRSPEQQPFQQQPDVAARATDWLSWQLNPPPARHVASHCVLLFCEAELPLPLRLPCMQPFAAATPAR